MVKGGEQSMVTDNLPADILLVEDELASARLVQEALRASQVAVRLSMARDGDQALAMLRRQEGDATAARPALILLDLNMPKKDGFAVLTELRVDPTLKRIPVIVLTTSSAPQDIQRSYDLDANCYIVKPRDLLGLITVIKQTTDLWLNAATLPLP